MYVSSPRFSRILSLANSHFDWFHILDPTSHEWFPSFCIEFAVICRQKETCHVPLWGPVCLIGFSTRLWCDRDLGHISVRTRQFFTWKRGFELGQSDSKPPSPAVRRSALLHFQIPLSASETLTRKRREAYFPGVLCSLSLIYLSCFGIPPYLTPGFQKKNYIYMYI